MEGNDGKQQHSSNMVEKLKRVIIDDSIINYAAISMKYSVLNAGIDYDVLVF